VRRWAAIGLVVVAAGAATAWASRQASQVSAPTPTAASGTARVVRMDLVTTQQVSGTIGYGPATALAAPGAAGPAAVAQAHASIDTSTAKLAADETALRDARAVNAAALAADQATLDAGRARQTADCTAAALSPQCAQDQQTVTTDQAHLASTRVHAQQALDQAEAAVNQDQTALADARAQAAPVLAMAGSGGTTYSSLPAAGTVVAQGQALYAVDGRPVSLLYGDQAAYRALTAGVSGPDVAQLERDLIALGFADSSNLQADGSFTAADAAAVSRWQAAAGVPRTGVVALGDMVFQPGPVRVTTVHVSPGSPVQPGAPIMDLTSSTRVVTVPLDPAAGDLVRQGDAVTVDLPDGRSRAPGIVSGVGTVAVQQTGSAQPSQNGAPQSAIAVTISLGDPGAVTALDQAPVTVEITTQTAKNVLVVPVNGLLALAGGGYGLEVIQPGGRHRLVQVRAGIFDSGRVQVSGTGLAEGMTIVVPAS
jgi:peptidoglycan hydrolase-like protein with peptidoglycan-binding domain